MLSLKWAFPLSLYFILGALPPPLSPSPTQPPLQCMYTFAGGGGWTVRHTSDVITRKRRDVQDVHLCQYVTFIEINRISLYRVLYMRMESQIKNIKMWAVPN